MELPDADLKTDTAGKRQHFQKDFFGEKNLKYGTNNEIVLG